MKSTQRFPRLPEGEILLKVPPRNIKRLDDPHDESRYSYEAQVPVTEAAKLIIGKANPRYQNTNRAIPREIRQSLDETPDLFHLKNRGIWVAARRAEYDNQSGTLKLFCPQDEEEPSGTVDGGHTLAVIREWLEAELAKPPKEKTPRQKMPYVMLHIRVGVEDEVTDLAACLNRSAQLKEYNLAHFRGDLEELENLISTTHFHDLVDYKEFGEKPYDVLDVIQRLTLFCNGLFPAKQGNHPIVAYSSKARCLDLYLKRKDEYLALKPILADCFLLPDQVERILPEISGSGRFGGYTFATSLKKPRLEPSLQNIPPHDLVGSWDKGYDVSAGVTFPLAASVRVLVRRRANGKVIGWREDPVKFFLKNGQDLFQLVLQIGERSPTSLGKNPDLWATLYLAAYQALHPED